MTANPNQGWCIRPKNGAKLRRTEAGRFALALEVTHDGRHITDIEHVYTGPELEELYRQMRTLYAEGVTFPAPEDRSALAEEMGQWQ